ncbi:BnaC04g19540D [Brassica napus]|uniref:Uncharacterized protein n=3 Tax=Brassica TaxID=3705 RepID=A0A3P6C6Y0_BRAOL|nr:unnamed protein product [Brassica napus]CDY08645.1 BnaC04g19540D [Brassica napus]VDD08934.1 unnamed protein product [Brassica oleracea]
MDIDGKRPERGDGSRQRERKNAMEKKIRPAPHEPLPPPIYHSPPPRPPHPEPRPPSPPPPPGTPPPGATLFSRPSGLQHPPGIPY